MTIFKRLLEKHLLKIAVDMQTLNNRINNIDVSQYVTIGDVQNEITVSAETIRSSVDMLLMESQQLNKRMQLIESISDNASLIQKIETLEQATIWKQAFWGSTKIADYKENALCTVSSNWQEMRIEYKLKNSTQSQFVLLYNDIKSKSRKAYSLGQGVADIVMETDGQLKCFSVTEPNVRILGVFWR